MKKNRKKKCLLCGCTLRIENYHKHMTEKHKGEELPICKICGINIHPSNLKEHVALHHNKINPNVSNDSYHIEYIFNLYMYIVHGDSNFLHQASLMVKKLPAKDRGLAAHRLKSVIFHEEYYGVFFGKIKDAYRPIRINLLNSLNEVTFVYDYFKFISWIDKRAGKYIKPKITNKPKEYGNKGKFGLPKDPYGPNWYGSTSFEYDFTRTTK